MNNPTTWMIVQATATTIAVIVAVAAILSQRSIQRQQQKQDLFDKRLALYNSIYNVLYVIHLLDNARSEDRVHMAKIQLQKAQDTLLEYLNYAEFLLGEEHRNLYILVQANSALYRTLFENTDKNPTEFKKTRDWLINDGYRELRRLFEPYLNLHQTPLEAMQRIEDSIDRLDQHIDQRTSS